VLAFSGFIPVVEGWQPDLDRRGTHVFIAHGRSDPIMAVDFGRRAHDLLEQSGFPGVYHGRTRGTRSSPPMRP